MEDQQIIELYWQRSESAIAETDAKYGPYCHAIARSVLASREDADEAVNDTWLSAWNAMPPHRPSVLSAFLGRITRRLSIDKWRRQTADKRGGGQLPLALEELTHCLPGGKSTEEAVEHQALRQTVDAFVSALPEVQRRVFLRRYWYLDSLPDIAKRFGFRESKVKSMLHRTRLQLRDHLEQEGFL